MKRFLSFLLIAVLAISLSVPAFAADPNLDGGGGGMGQGTSQNKWTPGRDGVRITVIRDSDNTPVTTPLDFSNQANRDVVIHFGSVSKLSYRSGSVLTAHNGNYYSIVPANAMPRIVSSSGGNNIVSIRSYFCREGTIRDIAAATGFSYDALISGEYKILLEPMAYFTYGGIIYAMTATEAALMNQKTSNNLRSKMASLTSQNLPLAMFLETADLGFPAWSGGTSGKQSDQNIIAALGLGIIRFSEPDPEPAPESDVTYRCDTEVITSVTVSSGSQKTPDSPAYVRFTINGRTYTHSNIYIPEDGSQLAWVKWRTPSTPGNVTITITSNCTISTSQINAEVVDLNQNPPPDPQADDRNDGFAIPAVPNNPNTTTLTWGEWDCWWHEYWVYHGGGEDDDGYWCDHGWWQYEWIPYSASLSVAFRTNPDEKSPTANGNTMKSGYGLNASVTAQLRSSAPSGQITGMQNVVTYFPEFQYATYWRLLKRLNTGFSSSFEFQQNKYSTYGQSVHFTPVWFPDGRYTTYAECIDAWTPAGMLQINLNSDITLRGSLFDDWHIRPLK